MSSSGGKYPIGSPPKHIYSPSRSKKQRCNCERPTRLNSRRHTKRRGNGKNKCERDVVYIYIDDYSACPPGNNGSGNNNGGAQSSTTLGMKHSLTRFTKQPTITQSTYCLLLLSRPCCFNVKLCIVLKNAATYFKALKIFENLEYNFIETCETND